MTGFSWLIFSYLLGSFPSGYLISRISGKNVLKIGWRKTSGSNVFKNVGKRQGVLTGILDVTKGYLAIYGAQRLGFSSEIQIFSGVAAVTGHNWSLFLKFAGGRGIGTFIGAFLALSPQLLVFSLIPFLILTIIWTASIGTLLFLITAIFLSIYFNQFEIGGLFTIISLFPILIKRLSPIAEIRKVQNKAALIRNRLIFDNDEAVLDFRIKKIIKKEKNNPSKVTKIVKPLTAPLLVPPKLGWEAAKFGVKVAKKPIEKLLSREAEKVVLEIRVEDFKKMMLAASKKIVLHQEEINRINVWPVADKDTGYNLAATLLGVEGTISSKEYSNLRELTKDIRESCLINARGNAGMIYTGYIVELLERIKHLETIDAFHLALAMKRGIKAARLSIVEPVEGTILDVIKAVGNKAYQMVKEEKEKNIIKVLEESQKVSEIALRETKEKLKVLKESDVVDAGALGFVKILESWIESLKGMPISSKEEVFSPITLSETKEKLEYRYEVILSFKKTNEINTENLKKELTHLGESIEIVKGGEKLKIHIHTNQPEAVKEKFKNFPELEIQEEDMEKQLKKIEKKSLGLVVDEIADLPEEIIGKYEIFQVPFTTRFPDGKIVRSKEEIYAKIREALKQGRSLPTTSAPSFKEFLNIYQEALTKFEKILVITVSAKLSGAYSSARIARSIFKKPTKLNIYVFDCNTAEVGEGLVVLRAQKLISQGKKINEVVEELKEFCPKVTLIGCLDDFRYVVRGGRLKLPKILVSLIYFIQKIGIRLLAGLEKGKVKIFGISLGKDVARILAKKIEERRKGKKIKVAIAHADNFKVAKKLEKELKKKPDIEIAFSSSISSVVGTHTGPGSIIVAFHPLDE